MRTFAEKRTFGRDPTPLRGQIHHLDSTVDCTIRNASLTGACLSIIGSNEHIPNRFALLVGDDGSYEKCHVVWRSADEIGVTFECDDGA